MRAPRLPHRPGGRRAHPELPRRSGLTGSSRGLYKKNGDLIAIPHKVDSANWKLVEAQANKVTVNRLPHTPSSSCTRALHDFGSRAARANIVHAQQRRGSPH